MRGDRTNHLLFVMASLGRQLQLNASYWRKGRHQPRATPPWRADMCRNVEQNSC